MRYRFIRRAGLAGAVLAVGLCAASITHSAFAHARPVKVSPGDGAVLGSPPSQVTMDTSDPVSRNAGDNSLVLMTGGGQTVTGTFNVDAARQHLVYALSGQLAVGTYTVQWKTTSAVDGDAAVGAWTFTYDPSKPASPGSDVPADTGHDAPDTATPAATSTAPAATATPPPATPTRPAATATAPLATQPAPIVSATPAAPTSSPTATATQPPSTSATAAAPAPAPPGTGTGLERRDRAPLWLPLAGLMAAAGGAAILLRSRRR